MTDRLTSIRAALASGPMPAEALRASLDVSRPTLARALAAMASEIVTLGAARATRYALRDNFRGIADIAVFSVNASGKIETLGRLCPVRPDGFVMVGVDGTTVHYEGLPWWLIDMRPQGFLGRAYAHQHANGLGLPPDVRHWSDTDALRALLSNGVDAVGNLLLGDLARDRFVHAPTPSAFCKHDYPRLAAEALSIGNTWSSAGGEQPKFCAYTTGGHVLVKFSASEDNAISARWRDLLLTEHIALEVLATGGVSAAKSSVLDIGGQRFLELERFDRLGAQGRCALLSLAALDGEFVGNATSPWPVVTSALARLKVISADAHAGASFLYAFGTLIGNTDMHAGNLSFVGDSGPPYALSPAYDMLPMGFSPTTGGTMKNALPVAHIHASIDGATWRAAQNLATKYLARLTDDDRWSEAFQPCIHSLQEHLKVASQRIAKLG